MNRWALVLLGASLVVSCAADPEVEVTTPSLGAETPVAAIEELQVLLAEGDFEAASALAVPGHAALASLAEGAPFSQVAESLRTGDASVASNFWNGFAQGAGDVLAEGATIADAGLTTESSVEFNLVDLTPAGSSTRTLATQDIDGYRVDLFASFAVGLAERMITPVEMLLSASTPDASLILAELQGVVPSLLLAASDQSLPPDAVQSILQLIELITRVG